MICIFFTRIADKSIMACLCEYSSDFSHKFHRQITIFIPLHFEWLMRYHYESLSKTGYFLTKKAARRFPGGLDLNALLTVS
jgi:hypothetical protein